MIRFIHAVNREALRCVLETDVKDYPWWQDIHRIDDYGWGNAKD